MKKFIQSFMTFMLLVMCLTACGSDNKTEAVKVETESSQVETTEASETEEQVAEGYDLLGGQLWEVGAIYYRNKVIDIKDNAALADLYDSTFLSFGSDGTFDYINLFIKEGVYVPYEGDGNYPYFLLKADKTLKYDSDKKEFVESESSSKVTYLLSVLDDNTIEFVEYDAITGRAKANEDPLFFVKSDKESSFVQNNKTDISQSGNKGEASQPADSGKADNSQNTGSYNSSYQAILDEYTRKMENAVDGLVREYRSEASGISDIEKLAEICNDKNGDLAEICNEGVGEMADLMYSKGDSYDTYESWAGKLMDNYNDIAKEIMDAYLDSAMN